MICKIMREREPIQKRRFPDTGNTWFPVRQPLDVNMSTWWTNLIKSINLDTLYKGSFTRYYVHCVPYQNHEKNENSICRCRLN